MENPIEVLFTPADFSELPKRDLADTICVVFDVLRATSTIVAALANGASGLIPVSEISEALDLKRTRPDLLLAGERNGLRIAADLTGGSAFDLGNSPREFTPAKVAGRTIVTTTTNGTRALRACQRARSVFIACFLNLSATAAQIRQAPNLLLVCSGTFEQLAYEDVLAAGALCEMLSGAVGQLSDSARIALEIYRGAQNRLVEALSSSRNGRRLLAHPDLREDVPYCARLDAHPIVAALGPDGVVRLRS